MSNDGWPREIDEEQPVPERWRPTIRAVVDRFVAGDFSLSDPVPFVCIDAKAAKHVRDYVDDYGCTLVGLDDATWESSVCSFIAEGRWEPMVDLWTAEEGRSDMVVRFRVSAHGDDFAMEVAMVFVP